MSWEKVNLVHRMWCCTWSSDHVRGFHSKTKIYCRSLIRWVPLFNFNFFLFKSSVLQIFSIEYSTLPLLLTIRRIPCALTVASGPHALSNASPQLKLPGSNLGRSCATTCRVRIVRFSKRVRSFIFAALMSE